MSGVLRDTLIIVPSVRLVRTSVRDCSMVSASTRSVRRAWLLGYRTITVIFRGQLHALVKERLQVDLFDGRWRFRVVVRINPRFLCEGLAPLGCLGECCPNLGL